VAISLSGCMSAGMAQLNGAQHGRHRQQNNTARIHTGLCLSGSHQSSSPDDTKHEKEKPIKRSYNVPAAAPRCAGYRHVSLVHPRRQLRRPGSILKQHYEGTSTQFTQLSNHSITQAHLYLGEQHRRVEVSLAAPVVEEASFTSKKKQAKVNPSWMDVTKTKHRRLSICDGDNNLIYCNQTTNSVFLVSKGAYFINYNRTSLRAVLESTYCVWS